MACDVIDDVSVDASDAGSGGAIVRRPQNVDLLNSEPDLKRDLLEDRMVYKY